MDRPCSRLASEHAGGGNPAKEHRDAPQVERYCRHHWHRPRQEHTALIGLDARGGIVLREKVARDRVVARLANVPLCRIGIEAGTGTHYVTRDLIAVSHDVRQVPPVYAKPSRQAHKNDFRDAHAIAEAVQRPTTRCVPAKDGRAARSSGATSRTLPPGRPADRTHGQCLRSPQAIDPACSGPAQSTTAMTLAAIESR